MVDVTSKSWKRAPGGREESRSQWKSVSFSLNSAEDGFATDLIGVIWEVNFVENVGAVLLDGIDFHQRRRMFPGLLTEHIKHAGDKCSRTMVTISNLSGAPSGIVQWREERRGENPTSYCCNLLHFGHSVINNQRKWDPKLDMYETFKIYVHSPLEALEQ